MRPGRRCVPTVSNGIPALVTLVDRVGALLHEPTQVRDDSRIDLGLESISRTVAAGRVDVGGGKFEPIEPELIRTERRSANLEYSGSELTTDLPDQGQHVAPGEQPVLVQARASMLNYGAAHPAPFVVGVDPMSVNVPNARLWLNETIQVTNPATVG